MLARQQLAEARSNVKDDLKRKRDDDDQPPPPPPVATAKIEMRRRMLRRL
jgi:hypothetical protein